MTGDDPGSDQARRYADDLRQVLAREAKRDAEVGSLGAQLEEYARDLRSLTTQHERVHEELEQARLQAAAMLMRTIVFRHAPTGVHSRRVGHYSRLLGQELGLSEQEAERVALAAPLHEAGIIGLRDAEIEALHDDCYVRAHCALGTALLGAFGGPLLATAREVIESHHEHWDGSGLPRGLRGQAIPLPGRIVALADSYDDLRRGTARAPQSHAAARRTLLEERSDQFDPSVLTAFDQLADRFDEIHGRLRDHT